MSSEHDVFASAHHSHMPAFCHPVDDTLSTISDYWRTCIPTYLALASTALGACSIVAWLFAQLPQIYKNMKIQSTAGLSVGFLVVWCAGDLSNLVGALLTGQATWQVVIGAYYSTVDLALVGQYIWYEKLGHGRKARKLLERRRTNEHGGGRGGEQEPLLVANDSAAANGSAGASGHAHKPGQANGNGELNGFKFPALVNPGAQEKDVSPRGFSGRQKNVQMGRPTGSFVQSPNLVLLVACLCIALGQASPVSRTASTLSAPVRVRSASPTATDGEDPVELVGRIISWCSTFLYLISRLPQLIKNYRRKSTAGLSPTLFAAAFCGNLFYSSSLLTNPLAWSDYGPHGHRGWAGASGSIQSEWILSATPFFLGAAGVLALDAAVGVQFLVYGDGRKQRYAPRLVPAVVIESASSPTTTAGPGTATPPRSHVLAVPQRPGLGSDFDPGSWRRVSGYMRGWVPSFSPGSFSGRGGYMAAAVGAGRAARDRIASGFASPRATSPSGTDSPERGGGVGVPVNRNISGIRAQAEAWESRRNSRQGSVASDRDNDQDGDTSSEDRPLLEGEPGRYGSL